MLGGSGPSNNVMASVPLSTATKSSRQSVKQRPILCRSRRESSTSNIFITFTPAMLAALRRLGKITIRKRRSVHLWAAGPQSSDELLNRATLRLSTSKAGLIPTAHVHWRATRESKEISACADPGAGDLQKRRWGIALERGVARKMEVLLKTSPFRSRVRAILPSSGDWARRRGWVKGAAVRRAGLQLALVPWAVRVEFQNFSPFRSQFVSHLLPLCRHRCRTRDQHTRHAERSCFSSLPPFWTDWILPMRPEYSGAGKKIGR